MKIRETGLLTVIGVIDVKLTVTIKIELSI